MVSLKTRSSEEEIMDDFSQSGEVIKQTLKELDRINTLLGGNQVSTSGLKKLLSKEKSKIFHIADLGCGGGDLMVEMSKWGKKNGYDLSFTGIDANTSIIDYARENTKSYRNINYKDLNIFSSEFKEMKFDVVHCSLFTHHFTDEQLSILIKQLLTQSKAGIVINDLHRHIISYYFTRWVISALSKSEMVRYDSIVSVARSFKRKELLSILEKAEVSNFSLTWKWAYRWQLIIFG
ncbi:methyltransferase domain-containing protein [Reichenbachiella sp. MALMAid0571]|uniref:methyltransferase domain-containing protein n=1 Tax=Reichenbachiella sp. MALMAid0571 TaxID=3143939 RepID=UPI0032DE30CD